MRIKEIKQILINKGALNFLTDEKFVKKVYKFRTNKILDLNNPQTFNEKLQWLKLYERKPEYTKIVDKYEAKEYIANIIGEEYIIPTLAIYEKFEDIEWDKLPNKFVIKCTHDSGGLVICKDKKSLDMEKTKKKINKSLKRNYYYAGREWPYKYVKPRIIIETLLEDEELPEYKFFCFNGNPKYVFIARGKAHTADRQASFYDIDLHKTPFGRTDMKEIQGDIQKPENYNKMVELAEKLSENNVFLRVDFYNLNGKIYCGELTFFPCSGYIPFKPEEYDKILGDMLNLPGNKIEGKNEK